MRINVGATTKIARRLAGPIKELLEAREYLERVDKNKNNGWDEEKQEWNRDQDKRMGCQRLRRYNKALKRLVDLTLQNHKFRIKLSSFNSADPLAIRKIALDGATEEELAIYLHGTDLDRNPKANPGIDRTQVDNQIFAIGVKMFGNYNQVVKTRVGVMVIWPKKAIPDKPSNADGKGKGDAPATKGSDDDDDDEDEDDSEEEEDEEGF